MGKLSFSQFFVSSLQLPMCLFNYWERNDRRGHIFSIQVCSAFHKTDRTASRVEGSLTSAPAMMEQPFGWNMQAV